MSMTELSLDPACPGDGPLSSFLLVWANHLRLCQPFLVGLVLNAAGSITDGHQWTCLTLGINDTQG